MRWDFGFFLFICLQFLQQTHRASTERNKLFLHLKMLEGFKGVPLWINFQGQETHQPWKRVSPVFQATHQPWNGVFGKKKKKIPFHFLLPPLCWANNPLYKTAGPDYTSCTCLGLAPERVKPIPNLPWLWLYVGVTVRSVKQKFLCDKSRGDERTVIKIINQDNSQFAQS